MAFSSLPSNAASGCTPAVSDWSDLYHHHLESCWRNIYWCHHTHSVNGIGLHKLALSTQRHRGRMHYQYGASVLTLGWVTSGSTNPRGRSPHPTQKGYVQVELAHRALRSLPICAWYAERVTKPLHWPSQCAFIQNAYRSVIYSTTAVEKQKGMRATRRSFLPSP